MKTQKRIISKIVLLLLCLTVFLNAGLSGVLAANKTVKVKGKYYQTDARKMLKKINKFRTGKDAWYYKEEGSNEKVILSNLSKLTYDYDLEKAAMQRAAELALSFSHTRPNGESCFSLTFTDGSGRMTVGENIAYGQPTVESVFEDWQETNKDYNGQGHRRNMLSEDFTSVGIACFEIDDAKYWVQEFGAPNSGASKTKAVNKKKTVKVEVAG